jgi:hypothetical protein
MTGVPETVEEDGKERKLTTQEKEEFNKVYEKADSVIQKLIKTSEYRRLSDASKSRLLKAIYAYYYKLAKQEVLEIDTLSEKMTFNTLNEGYEYFLARASAYKKGEDKDEFGD